MDVGGCFLALAGVAPPSENFSFDDSQLRTLGLGKQKDSNSEGGGKHVGGTLKIDPSLLEIDGVASPVRSQF